MTTPREPGDGSAGDPQPTRREPSADDSSGLSGAPGASGPAGGGGAPPGSGFAGRSRDIFEAELASRGIRVSNRGRGWIWLVAGFALGIALFAHRLVDQRGTSVVGRGHLVVQPDGAGTWAFLSDGSMVEVEPEGVAALGLSTGACSRLRGWLREKRLVLEEAECAPGGLLRPVMERLRELRLRPEYWADSLAPGATTPEPFLDTVELHVSMVDRSFDHPQIVPLYRELFPGRLERLREEGRTGRPTIFHVARNDFVGRRLGRAELDALLGPGGPVDRHGFVLAGAAAAGGWSVREVTYDPQGPGPVERLLVAPLEAPWPELLAEPNLKVRPPARLRAN